MRQFLNSAEVSEEIQFSALVGTWNVENLIFAFRHAKTSAKAQICLSQGFSNGIAWAYSRSHGLNDAAACAMNFLIRSRIMASRMGEVLSEKNLHNVSSL